MGENKTKVTGFRIENTKTLMKLSVIADRNKRSRNKEVEYALDNYVAKYEEENGEIKIKE